MASYIYIYVCVCVCVCVQTSEQCVYMCMCKLHKLLNYVTFVFSITVL